MLHYLENLFHALDFGSMGAAALRVAAIFLCLTVHETCHGLAAYVLGDPTAKSMHRLSLNPLRHIDWFGLLMMFAVGFGWAKPVPVDPRYFRKPKQGMAVTALAGPVSNLLLAAAAILAARFIYLSNPSHLVLWTVFDFCLYILAPLSVGLGLFNLLPIPPLDGAKVLGRPAAGADVFPPDALRAVWYAGVVGAVPDRYWRRLDQHGHLSGLSLADRFHVLRCVLGKSRI